jgi:hypothetical protein
MKMKNRLTSVLIFGFSIAAWSQQSAPPPVAPAESGPTLAATMQYIQEKLSEQGKVGWAETFSNRPGWTQREFVIHSDVMADPAACALYTTGTVDIIVDLPQGKTFSIGGKPVTADDLRTHIVEMDTFFFKQIEKVTVEKQQDMANQAFVEAAHPEITVTVTPPVFAVKLWASTAVFSSHTSTTKGNQPPVEKDAATKTNGLFFRDEDTANRVAKAMTHAMQLCGGGVTKKELF